MAKNCELWFLRGPIQGIKTHQFTHSRRRILVWNCVKNIGTYLLPPFVRLGLDIILFLGSHATASGSIGYNRADCASISRNLSDSILLAMTHLTQHSTSPTIEKPTDTPSHQPLSSDRRGTGTQELLSSLSVQLGMENGNIEILDGKTIRRQILREELGPDIVESIMRDRHSTKIRKIAGTLLLTPASETNARIEKIGRIVSTRSSNENGDYVEEDASTF